MWFIISISELKDPSQLFSVRHENQYKTDLTMLIDTIDCDYSTILDNHEQYKDCLDDFEPSFTKYRNFFHPYCEFIYNTEETIIR